MADRTTAEKWLAELAFLPTASGSEAAVVEWVTRWVGRRSDLALKTDSGGNLIITQKGRKRRSPVFAVAHMDHPAFVVTSIDGSEVRFEFRGGVNAAYFDQARVVMFRTGDEMVVSSYDPHQQTGVFKASKAVAQRAQVGDVGLWKFPREKADPELFHAPACDDLAGVAASLAALDRARADAELRHFGVLLTRAEEVGLVGAIHAAKFQTIPLDSRMLSIETSRELPQAPLGAGPIIRTGDRSTVFDRELTNRISRGAAASGLKHQRKLMDGGGCEATAFGAYGYSSTGLCVALRNWHNRGNLDQVEAGEGEAVTRLEAISLSDFHGLVDLILIAARWADGEDSVRASLDALYDRVSPILSS